MEPMRPGNLCSVFLFVCLFLKDHSLHSGGRESTEAPEKTSWLTNGAVGTHPVGIAAAEASVGEVGAMPTALVWALDPCQLTV